MSPVCSKWFSYPMDTHTHTVGTNELVQWVNHLSRSNITDMQELHALILKLTA